MKIKMYLLMAALSLTIINCAGTYTNSDAPTAFAYICVGDTLNKIIIMNNNPIYSKFIAERIDTLRTVLLTKELFPGPTKMSGMGADWDDTVLCSKNVYYRIFAIDKTGNKTAIRVAHGVNQERQNALLNKMK
jgi:hypothetical protein